VRRETEVQVLDLELNEPSFPPRRSKTRGIALAGVCLSMVVGLQLIPSTDPPFVETTPVSNLVDPAVEAVEIIAPFQWVQVEGLDRFDTVTEPVTTDSGYLAVGNQPGISGAASVVVSSDGSQWNRWGTIHGVGGEVEISAVGKSPDEYLAFGSYTEAMPKTEYAIHERLPAVWSSGNGIRWEMQDMSYTSSGVAMSTRDSLAAINIEELLLNGSVDYLGKAGEAVAVLLTATTSAVSVREPGMRGDSFATRVNETTHSLMITKDQVQWTREVVPFERIDFVGDVAGTFLMRAWSGSELGESAFWLVTP
jgi:hypothetical protein